MSDAKHRLLQATIDLIWQHSYGAVTVDGICERARVKKGSFYYFFPSKTDLVVAALESHWQTVKPILDRIFDPSVPVLDRFKNYFEAMCDMQLEMQRKTGRILGCAFCSVGSETSNSDPAICEKVQELIEQYSAYFEGAIRDLQAEGLVPKQDVQTQVRGLFAYMHGNLGQARIQNDFELVRCIGDGAFKYLGVAAAATA